eukprot:PhM_4_TR7637/c2_g1_i1/m.12294
MSVNRVFLLAWVKELTNASCSRYDDLSDGTLLLKLIAEHVFPRFTHSVPPHLKFSHKKGLKGTTSTKTSEACWDEVSRIMRTVGVPGNAWDRAGMYPVTRPRAAYNLLVLLYFLWRLRRENYVPFTLDFAQPIDIHMADFLQSPKSIEVAKEGDADSTIQDADADPRTSRRGSYRASRARTSRSRSPRSPGGDGYAVDAVPASASFDARQANAAPDPVPSPRHVESPKHAQNRPTRQHPLDNNNNNNSNSTVASQLTTSSTVSPLMTLRYNIKCSDRARKGLENDILVTEEALAAALHRHDESCVQERDMLCRSREHVIRTIDEEGQSTLSREQSQFERELQKLHDVVDFQWDVISKKGAPLPQKQLAALKAKASQVESIKREIDATRERVVGLRSQLEDDFNSLGGKEVLEAIEMAGERLGQALRRGLYHHKKTYNAYSADAPQCPVRNTLAQMDSEAAEFAAKRSEIVRSHEALSKNQIRSAGSSSVSDPQHVFLADNIDRLHRLNARYISALGSPVAPMAHSAVLLSTPLPTVPVPNVVNAPSLNTPLQYSLAVAQATTWSRLHNTSSVVHHHPTVMNSLRGIVRVLSERLAQARKSGGAAATIHAPPTASQVEVQLDLRSAEQELSDTVREMALNRTRWATQLQSLCEDEVTTFKSTLARYRSARTQALHAVHREGHWARLIDLQKRVLAGMDAELSEAMREQDERDEAAVFGGDQKKTEISPKDVRLSTQEAETVAMQATAVLRGRLENIATHMGLIREHCERLSLEVETFRAVEMPKLSQQREEVRHMRHAKLKEAEEHLPPPPTARECACKLQATELITLRSAGSAPSLELSPSRREGNVATPVADASVSALEDAVARIQSIAAAPSPSKPSSFVNRSVAESDNNDNKNSSSERVPSPLVDVARSSGTTSAVTTKSSNMTSTILERLARDTQPPSAQKQPQQNDESSHVAVTNAEPVDNELSELTERMNRIWKKYLPKGVPADTPMPASATASMSNTPVASRPSSRSHSGASSVV